jgi:hypothetical protein
LLDGAAAAWPFAARAEQSERMRRIGILMANAEDESGIEGSACRIPAGAPTAQISVLKMGRSSKTHIAKLRKHIQRKSFNNLSAKRSLIEKKSALLIHHYCHAVYGGPFINSAAWIRRKPIVIKNNNIGRPVLQTLVVVDYQTSLD